MKTKIGLPLGLALVMFIGVFTAMLALGVMAPQPASAAITAGFEVDLTNDEPGEETGLSFTFTTEEGVAATEAVNVIFATGYTVTAAGAWTLNDVPATAAVDGTDAQQLNLTPGAAIVAPIDPDTTIQIAVDYTPPGDDSGIKNPALPVTETDVDDSIYTISVKTTQDSTAVDSGEFTVVGRTTLAARAEAARIAELEAVAVTNVQASQDPTDPGANAQYQISFMTGLALTANVDTIRFNIDSSIGVPSSVGKDSVIISASDVTITGTDSDGDPTSQNVGGQAISLSFDPIYRPVPGEEGRDYYTIRVPDMDPRDDTVGNIDEGATVTVTFLPSAGLTNATEKGGDDIQVSTSRQREETIKGADDPDGSVVNTPLMLTIDDKADNRNKPLTVSGKGFRNGTTAIVYLDKDGDGERGGSDVDLVSVIVGSNDTFEATFNVTVPPFVPGMGDADDNNLNRINAVDGEAPTPNHFKNGPTFEVEGLMTVNPKSVAVGDKVQISLVDWPNGSHIGYDPYQNDDEKPNYYDAATRDPKDETARLLIGGVHHKIPTINITNGSADFEIEVNNDVPDGNPQIEFITTDVGNGKESDDTGVSISGASLTVTPVMVVPNQSITVVGRGFGDRKTINRETDGSSITLGGNGYLLTFGQNNFNNGAGVTTDSGGNWNASIVVPITNATTTAGSHILDISDSSSRSGSTTVVIAERTLTLEPALARPGESVTLTGSGFPATSSRSVTQFAPPVNIQYDGEPVGTVTPDASGNITLSFRVPLRASIPSTNTVRATFSFGEGINAGTVIETTIHEVPGATITLSASEGKAGDTLTVTGEGFKGFQSITELTIGGQDVIPSPKPATNNVGTFTTTILVPFLEIGTHSVEAQFGDEGTASGATVASAIFAVVDESADSMMPMTPVGAAAAPADAFAEVIAEDNLIAVYHFDPATQNEAPNYGYTFYDARPLFMSGNNLESIEPGQFYTVEVSQNQMGVTLGNQTVDLYAPFTPIRW